MSFWSSHRKVVRHYGVFWCTENLFVQTPFAESMVLPSEQESQGGRRGRRGRRGTEAGERRLGNGVLVCAVGVS